MSFSRRIGITVLCAILSAPFWLSTCAAPMIRRAKLDGLRKTLVNRTWKARTDIQAVYFGEKGPTPGSPVLFKKGTSLKIWLVSKAGWLKLKAYPAENDREQARGRTIIYIFSDDIRDSLRAQAAQQAPAGDKKPDGKKSGTNDKNKKTAGAGSILIPAEKIEELALKHLQQKINELLE